MKKNYHFRRIPDYIDQELSRIQSQYVIVAAVIDVTKTDIANGKFRHVGIQMNEGIVSVPETITPDMMKGIYARRNRNGIIWKQKNLPKVTKTYWWESPNFGDPTKGYQNNYRDIKDNFCFPKVKVQKTNINTQIINNDEHCKYKYKIHLDKILGNNNID